MPPRWCRKRPTTIAAIDEAMRLGYNWKCGPFELIDQLGAAWLVEHLSARRHAPCPKLLRRRRRQAHSTASMAASGSISALDGAYHDVAAPEGVLLLEDIKLAAKPVLKNGSAALWDIGDGVACFEFTSKMQRARRPDIMALLGKTIEAGARDSSRRW